MELHPFHQLKMWTQILKVPLLYFFSVQGSITNPSTNLQTELFPSHDFADLSLIFCRAFLNAPKYLIPLITVLFCVRLLNYFVDSVVLQQKKQLAVLSVPSQFTSTVHSSVMFKEAWPRTAVCFVHSFSQTLTTMSENEQTKAKPVFTSIKRLYSIFKNSLHMEKQSPST